MNPKALDDALATLTSYGYTVEVGHEALLDFVPAVSPLAADHDGP